MASRAHASARNPSTRAYVAILGALVGVTGVAHGVFEAMQGNRPTGGVLMPGIGALTLVPNFLITGIAAIVVGATVVIWSVGYIHRPHGAVVSLLLSVLLLLVGGGIALVPVFVVVFAVATRVNAPLSWWDRKLPAHGRGFLAAAWLPSLVAGLSTFVLGVVMWLILVPPGEPGAIGTLHYVVWSLLLVGFALLTLALVCGFARDLTVRRSLGAAQQVRQPDAP